GQVPADGGPGVRDAVGRAEVHLEGEHAGAGVDRGLDGLVEPDGAVQGALLDVGEQVSGPAPAGAGVVAGGVGPGNVARGEASVVVVVGVQGDADLLEVVGAGHAGHDPAHLLDGGEGQPEQQGDDGDHDE